jgi:D-sedoheptulose 7-phosphate isomerase
MTLGVKETVAAHQETVDGVLRLEAELEEAARVMQTAFAKGGRVYACGNGGSAADAQHFAAELTGRYEYDRPGYPAIALTTDTSALTAIGNDYGFDRLFARQLESLGRTGDVLLALSTSGNSPNVRAAVEYAKANGIYTIGLLGRDGGELAKLVDLPLVVAAERTPRIQEAHILMLHILCSAFESQSS